MLEKAGLSVILLSGWLYKWLNGFHEGDKGRLGQEAALTH